MELTCFYKVNKVFVFLRVMAKCRKNFILPLATRFHEETKLVHLGGLSVLPREKVNLNLFIVKFS